MRRRLLPAAIMLACAVLGLPGAAVSAAVPEPVVVAGKVSETNRGPLDPFEDAFINGDDVAFDTAYAFGRDAFRAQGMHRLVARIPGSDRIVDVEGPLLRDERRTAGATEMTIVVMALDSYAAGITPADVDTLPVALSLKHTATGSVSASAVPPGWSIRPTMIRRWSPEAMPVRLGPLFFPRID